jgi:hypothetical protein
MIRCDASARPGAPSQAGGESSNSASTTFFVEGFAAPAPAPVPQRDLLELTPDEALGAEDRVLGIGDRLALRDLPDQHLGSRPSMIATTLFVVPRSMPMILPIVCASLSQRR